MNISAILTPILDLLLPNHCLLCSAPCCRVLCDDCCADLPHTAQACQRCALPLPRAGICGECLRKPPSFDRTLSAYTYTDQMPQLITLFKHRSHKRLGAELSHTLSDRLPPQADRPDVLQPVPMHWQQRLMRGFNQADVIAGVLARRWGIPRVQWLQKRQHTQHQQQLTRKQRLLNNRQSFQVTHAIKALHIGLVDDVMTTGATVEILSHLLKCAGAAQVSVYTLARTPKNKTLHPH